MLEIFPVVWLELLISTSKVFEIGFSELKGYLVRLPRFCHGCCLVETILTSDPSTASNMAKTTGSMWELAKCAGKRGTESATKGGLRTRLISNPTIQLP